MQIEHNILITYGGVAKKYDKGDVIFREDTCPHFFYQIIEGKVKVYSTNSEGKELMQGLFEAGQSFGEPSLLLNKPYPGTAQACSPCVIIRIGIDKLRCILNDYHDVASHLLYTFAERLYQKANAAQVWVCHSPEEKIMKFFHNVVGQQSRGIPVLPIPYTRQQIADFTGLRVETVIRTLQRMSKQQKIRITDHKIFI